MRKSLIIVLVFAVVFAGCARQQSYRPSFINRETQSASYDDINSQDAAFTKNLKQGLAECEATAARLYEEAQELAYYGGVLSNEQQQIYTTLTDDQLADCQVYLESRRNRPLDPKTLVLLRAVKMNVSTDEYTALSRIWTGLAKGRQRFREIVAEMEDSMDRDAQLREGGKLYLKMLQGNRSRLAEQSMELTDEIRQSRRDSLLMDISESLREMSWYRRYGY